MADPIVNAQANVFQHGIRGTGLTGVVLPIFSGENWHLYRMRVEGELVAAGLWSILSGQEGRPAAAGDQQREYDRGLGVCKAALLRSLSDSVLSLVASCATAVDMWAALERRYAADTQTRRDHLFEKLLSFSRMTQGTLADHVASFQLLVNQYEAAGGVAAAAMAESQKRAIF